MLVVSLLRASSLVEYTLLRMDDNRLLKAQNNQIAKRTKDSTNTTNNDLITFYFACCHASSLLCVHSVSMQKRIY